MMIAGKYRYVVIEAEKSFRGEALVRYFRFAGTISDEDLSYPPGTIAGAER
jgi:hypothetical protein